MDAALSIKTFLWHKLMMWLLNWHFAAEKNIDSNIPAWALHCLYQHVINFDFFLNFYVLSLIYQH